MSEKINQEENKVDPSPPQPSPDVNARSQSVALPTAKSSPLRLSHAHFDIPNKRPELNTDPDRASSMGNIPGVAGSSRPKTSRTTSFAASMKKRQSMVRNLSTYSLYSNFAGEHLGDDYLPSRRSSMASAAARRRSTASRRSSGKYDEKIIGEEQLEVALEDEVPTASVGKAMFMFLKAFIGSGVLFLPKAFQNGGLALSIVLMTVIAIICFYAFLMLCYTQSEIGGSYGDMGGILYGQFLRYTVLFFIVISQIGFVCSYFIFVSGNFVSVVDVLSHCTSHIEQKYYVWFPLIILIPFSLVRHIAKLSFTVILADIFILFGLICIIYFTADQLHNVGVGPNVTAVNPVNFGLMIGTATFSFEGIGLIIPIVESMEKPEKFPLVLTMGLTIVCLVYLLIGTLSYLAYGDQIQAAVLYNFPPANNLTIAVELLYSLAICLTAPLMLFPALKIIENGLFARFPSGRTSFAVKWSKNIYRTILCVACAALAFGIGGDNLDKFVSLVGSVACVPLCFIFPGMFHIKVAKKRWNFILDAFLIVFGVGIMVYTLYVSIDSFINPKDTGSPLPPYCPT